jgi:hypothetical protein
MSDMMSMASSAFVKSFQETIYDWPLIIGNSGLLYVGGMLGTAVGNQFGTAGRYVVEGTAITLQQEYFNAYKHPTSVKSG